METDNIKETEPEDIHKQKTVQWKSQLEEKREQKKTKKKESRLQADSNPNDLKPSPPILDKVYKLKKKNKIILHNIYFKKSDVSFENIENLVTALDGKIVSNRGSHHTIILCDHASFIISKGTVVKPHGSSHSSGKLCRFNLKRVADCFERAGITPKVVSGLFETEPSKDVGQSIALRY